MKKILSGILVMVLLASVVPMAVMPAPAQQAGIPCDEGDNELTKDELVNAILPYMLDEGNLKLDDVGDAAYVYAYWNGEPKTITDSVDRTVRIYKPVERIVVLDSYGAEAIRVVGAKDRVVGVADVVKKRYKLFPELSQLPLVGTYMVPDAEKILALNPDIVFVAGSWQMEYLGELERAGIPIALLNFHKPETMVENVEKLGYITEFQGLDYDLDKHGVFVYPPLEES